MFRSTLAAMAAILAWSALASTAPAQIPASTGGNVVGHGGPPFGHLSPLAPVTLRG